MSAEILEKTPEGPRRVPLACCAAYCPVCTDWKARTMFPPLRRRVVERMGEEGAAAYIMLSMPHVTGRLHGDLGELAKEVRSAKTTPRWKNHFSARIGVVMALEISRGWVRRGHPHAHLFVFGPEKNVVMDFLEWIIRRWVSRLPTARVPEASMIAFGRAESEWAPRLFYTLKGSDVDPGWDPDLLLEAVGALGAGKQLVTFWGLASGCWVRRSRHRKASPVDEAA